MDELRLLEAHRAGDPEALATLLRSYQGRIYSICYRMLRDGEEASDLTQDSIVKVIQGLPSYDGRAKLSTWIIRVTMNCCLSYLRRKRVRRHASLDAISDEDNVPRLDRLAAGEPTPVDRVEHAEAMEALLAALGDLDPPARAALVLRDLQGLEYRQMAEVLDLPQGTVKSRIFRARVALREALERRLGLDSPRPESTDDADEDPG